jgi:hypothetical protein
MLKEVRRMLDRHVQSPNASKIVARHLRDRLNEMKAGGELPVYRMFVNDKETSDLSPVTFYGDTITIKFALLDGVVRAMLAYAQAISPVQSGAYRDAWFLAIDGIPVTDLSKKIPFNAKVILANFAPSARRLEEEGRLGRSGRLSHYARPELVVTERVRQWAMRKFPAALIERLFVTLPGGGLAHGWQVPYVLKTGIYRGEQITYPALQLSAR